MRLAHPEPAPHDALPTLTSSAQPESFSLHQKNMCRVAAHGISANYGFVALSRLPLNVQAVYPDDEAALRNTVSTSSQMDGFWTIAVGRTDGLYQFL